MKTLNHLPLPGTHANTAAKNVLNDHIHLKIMQRFMKFEKFSFSGKDLILTQKRHGDSDFESDDCFRDWRLINVDRPDCDRSKLSRLIKEFDVTNIKIIENVTRKRLIIKSDTGRYVFNCDYIEQETRGYSRQEILVMFRKQSDYLDQVEIEKSSLSDYLTRFFRFINREAIDNKNLMIRNLNNEDISSVKTRHYVELLDRIKSKLDDLKTILPEYSRL